jgi:hypothetical protein
MCSRQRREPTFSQSDGANWQCAFATTPAKTPEALLAKFTLIASGYAEDELDGTYDGVLASAALDAQSLANVRIGEART